MNGLTYTNDPRAVLCHFNPNHDPRNGQFAESSSGSSGGSKTVDKPSPKKYNKDDKNGKPQSSDKWKTAAKIGAVALGVSLAAIGGVYLYKSGKLDKYISAGKNMISKTGTDAVVIGDSGGLFGKTKRIVGRSPEQLNRKMISKINGPGPVDRTRQINCTHTTTAYIMNSLFGKKVEALPFSGVDELSGRVSNSRPTAIFHSIFDNVNEISLLKEPQRPGRVPISMDWMDGLHSLPPGTGVLALWSKSDGGHVVNYEKTAEGLMTIIDPQHDIIESGELGINAFQWRANNGFKLLKAFDLSNATLKENAEEVLKYMIK